MSALKMATASEAGPSSPRSSSKKRRLHLSGLNAAQCTVDDIKGRFSSFGLSVSDVDNWPPQENAVGVTTDWCFLTVHGDEAAIKRATNVLHNTMWKGHKVRIGKARKDHSQKHSNDDEKVVISTQGGEETSNDADTQKVAKERLKQERTRRRRGIAGAEDAHIDSPVSVDDVKAGKWGWKTTPAGHLLRPMHMRPSRPVPKPTKHLAPPAAPTDEQEGVTEDKRDKSDKDAKKRKTTNKTLARARCITIDPSRYHNIHLSGAMLLDRSFEKVPEGASWQYEEGIDGSRPRWLLIGQDGQVLREDVVKSSRSKEARVVADRMDTSTQEEAESAAPTEDEYEDSMGLEDVDAAIDQAQMSGTESVASPEPDRTMFDETFVTAPDVSTASFAYPHYDPAEEDEFSDGYQEKTDGTDKLNASVDWSAEKQRQIDILKGLFGPDGVETGETPAKPTKPAIVPVDDSEESESEDSAEPETEQDNVVQDDHRLKSTPVAEIAHSKPTPAQTTPAASRREMLLGLLAPAAYQNSVQFKPIERYDPSAQQDVAQEITGGDADPVDFSMQDEDRESQAPLAAPNGSIVPVARADGHVQMTTLTDMFRPKESKGAGFSLLDELDLDLDEDWAFDEDEEHMSTMHTPAPADDVQDVVREAQSALPTAGAAKGRPRMFPSTDEQGRLLTSDTSVFGVVMQRLRESGVIQGNNVAAFLQPEDAETLAKKWEHRKATLTQAYKRRHREALKKKRRKYVGARAAGTAAPAR